MTLILDTGALIAYQRGDRTVKELIERTLGSGAAIRTTCGVVAQVWRGGGRQAKVALLLRGVEEVELTRETCRRVGVLLGLADAADVVDASLVEAAFDGDEILTSDPADILILADASGKRLTVTPV